MRVKMLAYSVPIIVSVLFGASLIIESFTYHAARADEKGEKTVEQVKKNIQVLKGLPLSQLDLVMDDMATSLGVRCNHCHVIDSTGWYMEKDDKPAKRTARKMIQMVMDLNAKNFGGRPEVTCYTCHHGATEPAGMMPLPQAAVQSHPEGPEVVPSLPSAQSVIEQYAKAIGGADAIAKITTRLSKGISIDGQGREMPTQLVQESPGKFATSMTMREGVESKKGFDGKHGWMSSPRGTRALDMEENETLKQEGALFPLSRMEELSRKLRVREKTRMRDASVFVLTAPIDGYTDVNFYIDSASGLLLRMMTVTTTMIGKIPAQTDYEDYRSVGNVKVPFTVQTAAVDPRDGITRRFTSIEHNVKVEEKTFAMPEVKDKRK